MSEFNDPEILDGWDHGKDLLSWESGTPLLPWIVPTIEGEFDPSTHPLGGPVGERVYLVTMTLASSTAGSGDGDASVASYPVAALPFGASDGSTPSIQFRLSDVGFTTLGDDPDLPSVHFDGLVTDPGSLDLSLPLVPVGSAAIETAIGRVLIDNAEGTFDTILDQHAAVSQQVVVRGGRVGANLADFVTIFTGRITGVGMSETALTLDLQSPVVYAQNLYPTTVYTGLGGSTGDAEMEGAVKPVVLGRVWNMSPVLVNATSLVYQVHDGAVAAVTAVHDGGVALSFTANYASYAALSGASLTGGQYATCLAEGFIRVGGTPAFALTANVDGEGGITTRAIAKWLIGQLGAAIGLTVDADSFDALPEWTAGWLWTESFSFAEAISRFTGDAGYYWGADSDGVVRAVTLSEPAGPVVVYDETDILAIERVTPPDGYEGVHHRRQVRYRRNWTLQSDGELATTATARAGRQREWRTATATASGTALNAIDPPIVETSLHVASEAAALASYLVGMHGVARRMFAIDLKISGPIPRIANTVTICHRRFGLIDGADFRVVAADLRLGENAMRLLVWG